MVELGAFELIEPIGRGGMAEVWSGVHRDQQVPVAVKIVTSREVPVDRLNASLRNEVRAMARLEHPAILMVFDYGIISEQDAAASQTQLTPGNPYLVMELAPDGAVAPSCGKLPWKRVRRILLSLLEALAHAHARGVLHRDVKPTNVLLFGEQAKLSDFGVALQLDPARRGTMPSQGLQGTPAYMAPEQFGGHWRDYGPPTDLYALGCLAHTLVCGRPPYGQWADLSLMYRLHHEGVPLALDAQIPVPEGFEHWIRRLLEKKPKHRFQHAMDAAQALRALGAPPSTTSRTADGPPSSRSASLVESVSEMPTVRADFAALHEGDGDPFLDETTSDSAPPLDPPPDFPPTWHRAKPERHAMGVLGAGIGLYGLRAIPMVGRERIRDSLWSTLRSVARRFETRLVLLEGPAGCGKSKLAEWLCERALEAGVANVLTATHSRSAGPGHGLAHMLAHYLRCFGMSQSDLGAFLRRALSRLGAEEVDADALVEFMAAASKVDRSAETPVIRFASAQERYVLVARFVDQLCVRRPVILWLDDVQWGPDAIGFADHLLHREQRHRAPVLMLLTARIEELAEQTDEHAALMRCLSHPWASRMEIGPLPQANWPALVEQLLRLDPPLAARVAGRTRGNPLFAVHLVGDWVDRGLLEAGSTGFRLNEEATVDLPAELHEVWPARVERALADRPARDGVALELAAALGTHVEGEEWREVCAVAGVEATDELVEALASRRLALTDARGPRHSWWFVHGMLRESIEQRAQQAGRARDHHAACARMLRARRGAEIAERLGRHLIAAGEHEQALAPLRYGARERLDCGNYAMAEVVLGEIEGALATLKRPDSDPSWGECWVMRCRLAIKRGRFDDGLVGTKTIRRAAVLHGWPQLEAEALMLEGSIHRMRGNTAQSEQSLLQARTLARQQRADRLLAETQETLGRVLMHQGKLEQAEDCLFEARGVYHLVGDAQGAASALWSLAHVATYRGELTVAARHNDSAMEELTRLGDRWGVARCLNMAGEVNRLQGKLLAAEDHYHHASVIMKAIGAEDSAAICDGNVARVMLERGEHRAARSQLERLARDLERQQRFNALAWMHTVLVWCCGIEADWHCWQENLSRTRKLLADSGYLDLDIALAARRAGEAAVDAGEPERAREAFGLALEQWQALGRDQDAEAVQQRLTDLPTRSDERSVS